MASRKPRAAKLELNVFDFLSYRAFLRAYYEREKARPAGFSFRTFSKQAGLASPNFFKLVIDGQRNLGHETVHKVADTLGFDGEERAFFCDLVAFEQAEDTTEKNRAFERLAASRRFKVARRIDGLVHEYLSSWMHPVIRELVARPDFSEDPTWIAGMLRPQITPRQAQQSLGLLLSLGLLTRDPATNQLKLGEPTLTTEHQVQALGAANFHRQMLARASDSIDTVPSALRDLAALTVCVSPSTAAEVKRRIHQFREALTELCDSEVAPETVYQLNIQWFPLSQTAEARSA